MINQVRLMGTLGQDAQVKSFQNGDRCVQLRLAVNERWRDQSGDQRESVQWFGVTVFGDKRVTRIGDWRKGQVVEIDGKLRTRKYQKDGRDVYVTEVIVQAPEHRAWVIDMGRKGEAGGSRDPDPQPDLDGDVPF